MKRLDSTKGTSVYTLANLSIQSYRGLGELHTLRGLCHSISLGDLGFSASWRQFDSVPGHLQGRNLLRSVGCSIPI